MTSAITGCCAIPRFFQVIGEAFSGIAAFLTCTRNHHSGWSLRHGNTDDNNMALLNPHVAAHINSIAIFPNCKLLKVTPLPDGLSTQERSELQAAAWKQDMFKMKRLYQRPETRHAARAYVETRRTVRTDPITLWKDELTRLGKGLAPESCARKLHFTALHQENEKLCREVDRLMGDVPVMRARIAELEREVTDSPEDQAMLDNEYFEMMVATRTLALKDTQVAVLKQMLKQA